MTRRSLSGVDGRTVQVIREARRQIAAEDFQCEVEKEKVRQRRSRKWALIKKRLLRSKS